MLVLFQIKEKPTFLLLYMKIQTSIWTLNFKIKIESNSNLVDHVGNKIKDINR